MTYKEALIMNIEQIKEELTGYFLLNGATIAKKINDTQIKKYDEPLYIIEGNEYVKYTPQRLLLSNIQHMIICPDDLGKIKDLNQVLPSINLRVFTKYDARATKIAINKQVLEKLDTFKPKSLLGKKNHVLVRISNSDDYYVVDLKERELVKVDSKLVSANLNDAVVFDNYSQINNALRDNLENEYESAYEKELEKWEKL